MSQIAARYAKTLFQFTQNEDFREQLQAFEDFLQKYPDIHRFFYSPHVPLEKKIKVLEKGPQLNPQLVLFLKLLLKNRRFTLLPEVILEYCHLVRKRLGIVEAFLKSAHLISEDQKKSILQKLTDFTGKEVELETAIDPKLLGGGVLTINHHLIDFSIKGKLSELKEELLRKVE